MFSNDLSLTSCSFPLPLQFLYSLKTCFSIRVLQCFLWFQHFGCSRVFDNFHSFSAPNFCVDFGLSFLQMFDECCVGVASRSDFYIFFAFFYVFLRLLGFSCELSSVCARLVRSGMGKPAPDCSGLLWRDFRFLANRLGEKSKNHETLYM